MWYFKPGAQSFTLIIADGEKPSISLLKHYRGFASSLIALDGAANWLLSHQEQPDIVIGDLDSFNSVTWPAIPAYFVNDQESNDLEKALAYCEAHKLHRVLILGAFGRRIDHFLTNVFAVRKYALALEMLLIDAVQMAFILRPGEQLELLEMKGAWCSLFPFEQRTGPIATVGLQYPLHGEFLSLDHRIGTLNRIIEDKASILCEQGDLLITVPNTKCL